MARNGSGSYSLPAGNPVVTGTTISSTVHNNTMSDIATALTNSLAKDGQTTPTANLTLGNFRIINLGDATTTTDAAKVSQVQDSAYTILSSVSGTNTITATVTPTPSAYANGQYFIGVAAETNTGATTLNISSLGAKNVFYGGKALVGGEINKGALVAFRYDGTQFELVPLQFVSTESGASAGPDVIVFRNCADTASDSDAIGRVIYRGKNDAGEVIDYAAAASSIVDATDSSEDGSYTIQTMQGGTLTDALIAKTGIYTPNATGGDQGADTVNASELYEDGTRVLTQSTGVRMATGSYSGDGSTSNSITGVGFQPKFLQIWDSTNDGSAPAQLFTSDSYMSQDAQGLVVLESNVGAPTSRDNRVISLDSDGFTVSDDGGDNFPNTNGSTFQYVAWG